MKDVSLINRTWSFLEHPF